jgi:putative PIN family toxin of toxin-antitoxin system
MKAVLDTNVFVSALLGGSLSGILSHWRNGDFTLIVSEDIVFEYQSVLRRPRLGLDTNDITEVMAFVYRRAEFVLPVGRLHVVVEDEQDNRFFEAAFESRADFLVSGDRHVLANDGAMGIRVSSPRAFLGILKKL